MHLMLFPLPYRFACGQFCFINVMAISFWPETRMDIEYKHLNISINKIV